MMRALSTPLLAALLVAAVAAQAAAATAPARAAPKPAAAAMAGDSGVTGDVRCLMTMVAFGQDKTRQQAGQFGAYFFSGRINARSPGLDLAAAMKAEAPRLDATLLQAELKRCGPMVAAASSSLQTAINGLRPPGAPAAAGPAAPAPTTSAPAAATPPPK